ncbi:tetratricopeptide repeat protein [Fulvivirga sedimenti]|uniref:Tetratricopeptide repeat protein n=1 Tax=Fulvivirga sedimenti TaxID=2879465 RepID=A0A9X1KXR4_9BACT|nr:tetratricopeptide repeat protein [Fulvivirga sedimenti]MCA6074447.1 tetratricopeptide repeat protein [Fulvivirga sedimenti]
MKSLAAIGIFFLSVLPLSLYSQERDSVLTQLYAKANERLEEGAYKTAVIDYNQLVNSNFRDGKIYLKRGIAHYHLGEFQAAADDFDQAFRQQLRDPELIGYRGMNKYALKDYQGAGSDLEQAAMQGFRNQDAFYMLGNIRFQMGRYGDAIERYDEAEKLGLSTAVLFNNRGKAKLELNNNAEAVTDFNRSIKIDPSLEIAHRNRAEANFRMENWPEALKDLDHLIKSGDADANTIFQHGIVSMKLEKFEEAVSDFQRAEAKGISPGDINPLMAEAYYALHEFKKAAVYFDKIVRATPGDLQAWQKLGTSHYYDGQFVQADKALTEAIDRGNTSKESFGYRGMSRYKLDRKEDAFNDLTRVSTMGFTNEDAYYFLGEMLMEKGQNETAIAQLNKAIALNPQKCGAYEARARAYSSMNEISLALEDIAKAIKIEENSILWTTSGMIRLKGGQYKEAISDLQKAEKLGASGVEIYRAQSDALFALKEYIPALEKYRQTLKAGDDDPVILQRIAECEYRNGALEEAYSAFKKAEASAPVPSALQYPYAHSAFEKKDYKKVIALLSEVSDKGTPIETERMRAISYYALKQYEPAAAAAGRATSDVEMERIGGLSFYYLGKPELAIQHLEKAEKQEETVHALAKSYQTTKNSVSAEKNLTWLIDEGFGKTEYYVDRGTIRMETNKTGALADFNKALEIDPELKNARAMRAQILYNDAQYTSAITDLEILLLAGHDLKNVAFMLGISYLETGDVQKAQEMLEKAEAAGSSEPRLFAELGRIHFEAQNWEGTIQALDRAITPSQYADLRILRGQAHFKLEGYEKSVQDLETVKDHNAASLFALGKSYYELDRHERASATLKMAFDANSADSEIPYLLGNSYFRLDNYKGAIDSYLKAIVNGNQDPVLYNNLGKAYEQTGGVEDAISAYTKALEIDPDYNRARQNRGEALYNNGNYAGAIDDLSKIEEKDDRVNFYLAESYFKTSAWKQALQYYNRSIDGGRKTGDVYHQRGRTYLELDQVSAGLADIDLAIKAGKKDAGVYLDRARANIYLNNERAALTDLNEAIAQDKENPDAYYNRGYLRELQENFNEAISDYKMVISLDPKDDKAYYSLANSMVSVGNVGGALEPIDKAISLNDQDASYFKVKGNILYRIDRGEEACENWKKSVSLGDRKSSFYIDQYCK